MHRLHLKLHTHQWPMYKLDLWHIEIERMQLLGYQHILVLLMLVKMVLWQQQENLFSCLTSLQNQRLKGKMPHLFPKLQIVNWWLSCWSPRHDPWLLNLEWHNLKMQQMLTNFLQKKWHPLLPFLFYLQNLWLTRKLP